MNNNFPTSWVKKNQNESQLAKFNGGLASVSRWAARYRLAKSFQGLELYDSGNIKDKTKKLYNALVRIFLVYTTFEQYCKLTRISTKDEDGYLKILQDEYNQDAVIESIRKEDPESYLFRFVRDQMTDARLRKRLDDYINGNSCNVTVLAKATRHALAHGLIAGHSGGSSEVRKTGIAKHITKFLLEIMDKDFTKQMS